MDINKILEELDALDHTQVEAFLRDKIEQAKEKKEYGIQISLLNELIGFCRDTCRHEKNARNAEELLKLLHEQGLNGSQAYATSLLNIANAYRAAGRLEESLAYYKEVYSLYEKQLSPEDFLFASLNNNMALLYQEMNDYESACQCLQKALEIAEKTPDAVIETATTHTNLAQSFLRLNRVEEAMEHLDKALAIFAQDGNRDYHYSAALAVYAEVKYMLGEYQISAEYYEKAMQEFEKHMGQGGNYEVLRQNRDDALARIATIQVENSDAGGTPDTSECAKTSESYISSDYKAASEDGIISSGTTANFISGLTLCESFYQTCGKPMIHNIFPDYEDKIAVGLVGEGSDCFGFDDETSRDHDWGPGFCMWLPGDVYEKIGNELQRAYDQLPSEYMGYQRRTTKEGAGRMGVFTISGFYQRILGKKFNPNHIDWEGILEENLATAVNGMVFTDSQGVFNGIRNHLLSYYPDDIWKKKLGQELILMAKTGQYNYNRMRKREDYVTAQIFLGQFMEHTLHTVFLFNKTFAPYDKWLQAGAAKLDILPELTDILRAMADMSAQDEKISMTIEIIAQLITQELVRQGLIKVLEKEGDVYYLEPYGRQLLGTDIMDTKIEQPEKDSEQELHNKLIEKIVLAEWKAFDQVKNEGGRASCQDDWNTFSIMRKSQYMEWSNEMIESFLNDFRKAEQRGWNLITEKYGRMMESTTPEQYMAIKDSLPKLSERKKAIIEEIVKIQVGFMEELKEKYPKVAGTARSIHTAEDTPYNTSYETYLRGELGTYSDETLSLYGGFIVDYVNQRENLALHTMENTAYLYGYASLEELESRLE